MGSIVICNKEGKELAKISHSTFSDKAVPYNATYTGKIITERQVWGWSPLKDLLLNFIHAIIHDDSVDTAMHEQCWGGHNAFISLGDGQELIRLVAIPDEKKNTQDGKKYKSELELSEKDLIIKHLTT